MATAVIVDAVRSPVGRRQGALSAWHPVDLAAYVLRSLIDRVQVDPALIDDVVMGCVSQVGEQAFNIGRNAALAAGFPESVAGTTVDRQCGSSQQAVHFAAQGVIAGAYDLVVAAGVEHMSRVPMGESVVAAGSLPFRHGAGDPFGSALHARYPGLVPLGIAAETLATQKGITRDELDEYAVESHRRAARATHEGRFEREIVPIPVVSSAHLASDETVRPGVSCADLARLAPAFKSDGIVTAGNSAAVADGTAAVLIASEEFAERHGLAALARFRAFAVAGVDPVAMLTAAAPATRSVLERGKVALDDLDLVEVHESFAGAVLSWARELHVDPSRTNASGGAIALGHPLGASGARMLTTLVHELHRGGGRTGLQVMSEGGGTANALVVERI